MILGRETTGRRTTVDSVATEQREVGCAPGDALGTHRWRWTLGGALWLIFLLPAFNAALDGHHGVTVRTLTVLDLVAFVVAYVLAVPLTARRSIGDPIRYAAVGLVVLLGILALPGTGENGLATFVYMAVVAVALLPLRVAITFAAGVAALAAALAFTVPDWSNDPAGLVFSIVLATAASSAFVRLMRRNAELAVARGDLAELAVEQERARFARDLHDLLGHSLTVITVKSELAGRLMSRDRREPPPRWPTSSGSPGRPLPTYARRLRATAR